MRSTKVGESSQASLILARDNNVCNIERSGPREAHPEFHRTELLGEGGPRDATSCF
jgi:hypothetical protein